MKLIICGDRNWTDRDMIQRFLKGVPEGTFIIEGEAKGADTIAREEAEKLGFLVNPCRALWNLYGKAAGPIRNQEMLGYLPDLVVAFHDHLENSRGTKNMLKQARKKGIPIVCYNHVNLSQEERKVRGD